MNLAQIAKASNSAQMSETGITGLQRDAHYVHEEWLPALRDDKSLKIYREMSDNDPIIGGVLFSVQMLLRQVPWDVEAFDGSDEAKADAEFLRECMDDMSMTWADFISEALSFIPYGFSYFNIVYKRREGNNTGTPGKSSRFDDGQWGWRKFSQRAQDTRSRWEFDSKGGVQGMYQIAPPDYEEVFIPIKKGILFRPSTYKNNPEGRSALRNAYRPWYFKKRIENIEGIGIERDLAGIPIAYVDPKIMSANASDEDKAFLESIKETVLHLRRDQQEAIVMPRSFDINGNPLYEISLLGTGGSRQYDTSAIINRYDQRIAMTLLSDFIMLGHESTGSFALASSRTSLFAKALGAWMMVIQETLNRHAVAKLFTLNGKDLSKLPKIKYGDIATPDLDEMANYITRLSAAGLPLFPDEKLEQHLRDAARLPKKPGEGEEQPKTMLEQQMEVQMEQMEAQAKIQRVQQQDAAKQQMAMGRQQQQASTGGDQGHRKLNPSSQIRRQSPRNPRGTPSTKDTQRGI